MLFKKSISFYFILCLAVQVFLGSSCTAVDLYEKTVPIPKHEWSSGFKPQFRFVISDTVSPYQVFVILRHTDRYNFNNIWINLTIQAPADTAHKVQYELPLASKEKGWLGTGMDDIYEHRINITPANDNFYFRKSGEYVFTLEQVMREDPLQQVLDVGLRLEKKNP